MPPSHFPHRLRAEAERAAGLPAIASSPRLWTLIWIIRLDWWPSSTMQCNLGPKLNCSMTILRNPACTLQLPIATVTIIWQLNLQSKIKIKARDQRQVLFITTMLEYQKLEKKQNIDQIRRVNLDISRTSCRHRTWALILIYNSITSANKNQVNSTLANTNWVILNLIIALDIDTLWLTRSVRSFKELCSTKRARMLIWTMSLAAARSSKCRRYKCKA